MSYSPSCFSRKWSIYWHKTGGCPHITSEERRLKKASWTARSLNTHTHTDSGWKKTVGGEAERMRQTMEKRKLCIITKVQAKRLSWAAEHWKDEIWKANSWVVRSRSSLSLAISGLTHKRLRSLSAKQIENNWRSPNVVISSALHSLVTRTHSQEGHFTLTQRGGRGYLKAL